MRCFSKQPRVRAIPIPTRSVQSQHFSSRPRSFRSKKTGTGHMGPAPANSIQVCGVSLGPLGASRLTGRSLPQVDGHVRWLSIVGTDQVRIRVRIHVIRQESGVAIQGHRVHATGVITTRSSRHERADIRARSFERQQLLWTADEQRVTEVRDLVVRQLCQISVGRIGNITLDQVNWLKLSPGCSLWCQSSASNEEPGNGIDHTPR